MSHSKGEPRFDIDYRRGRIGELHVERVLGWIDDGNGHVEVKTKSYFDECLYVETSCDKGRTGHYEPSGISVTTAKYWVFVVEGTGGCGFLVSTNLLRRMLDDPSSRDKVQSHGAYPTKGKLVNFLTLLYRCQQHKERAVTVVDVPAASGVVTMPSAEEIFGR